MKNKIILLLTSILVFVSLLYHEEAGFNFLIFSVLMLVASYVFNPENSKTRMAVSIFLLITTFSVAYYGDPFSIMASIGLFFVLPFFVHHPKGNLLIAPIQSALNNLLEFSQIPALFDSVDVSRKSQKSLQFLSYFLIPAIVVLIVFFLYREINVDFKAAFSSIRLPEWDAAFFGITALACIYCFGFWYFKQWIPSKYYDKYEVFRIKNSKDEAGADDAIWKQSGTILFTVLNLLIGILLYFECQEIYCNGSTVEVTQLSENVHFSIQAVIASILIAVGLMMLYFKGNLNFGPKSSLLKSTAYIWVILNVGLLITSALKNQTYIESLGITEKRIGVDIFLLVALLGLGFTFYKIRKNQTNYALIYNMTWVILTTLVLLCPINWSKIITSYNINLYHTTGKALDLSYLNTLHYNDPEMMALENQNPKLFRSSKSTPTEKIEFKIERPNGSSFLSDTFYLYSLEKLMSNE